MINFFRDMPLRGKLLSYAVVMLGLILVSAGYATYSLNSIGVELTTIVEEDIPLTNKISLLTVTQLEQAVAFERSLNYGSKISSNPSALKHFEDTIRSFDKGTVIIDQAIKDAIALTNHASSTGNPELIQEFNKVKVSLNQLSTSHESYVEHAHQVFALLAKNEMHLAETIIEKVELEEEALEKQSEALLEDIQLFTEQSARTAKEHEESPL